MDLLSWLAVSPSAGVIWTRGMTGSSLRCVDVQLVEVHAFIYEVDACFDSGRTYMVAVPVVPPPITADAKKVLHVRVYGWMDTQKMVRYGALSWSPAQGLWSSLASWSYVRITEIAHATSTGYHWVLSLLMCLTVTLLLFTKAMGGGWGQAAFLRMQLHRDTVSTSSPVPRPICSSEQGRMVPRLRLLRCLSELLPGTTSSGWLCSVLDENEVWCAVHLSPLSYHLPVCCFLMSWQG